jgi:RNA-directed DNA polymerase
MSIKLAWKEVDWRLVQKRLSRQQRRVYKASMKGNRSKVHFLQKKILVSLDARLIAVRRVTTENKEPNTSGVDGQKILSNAMKMKLVSKLKLDGKASPIRRTYSPKPGKNEVRPLGISTIKDRAKQMLAKLALEPEWEAIFEPNSYGFRPGRSCHDAVASLFFSLRGKSLYVLDADIQKCFDQIDHDKLLRKLSTFDTMENQIRAWLRADIMLGYLNRPDEIFQSMESMPQGGVISPLLANIALHGLEEYIKKWYSIHWYPVMGLPRKVTIRDRKNSIGFSRYADNFVITAPKISDILQIEKQVGIWLNEEVGLSLSKAKTRIINSTEGFEFLGFQFISLKSDTNTGQYKVKIHPSILSQNRLLKSVRNVIQCNRSASSYSLINLLVPKIIGWANYFRFSRCTEDFSKIDYSIYNQLRAWVFRRKSKGLKSRTKLKEKYFPSGKTYVFRGKQYSNNWVFAGQTLINGIKKENFLPKLVWVGVSPYKKIKGNASPYDGNYLYWAERTKKYSDYSHRVSKLIKMQ